MAEEGTRAAVLERITDDHLQCSICQELYKEPKTLSCMHRFCMQCLVRYRQSHWDSNHLICPLCRQQTSVPGGDIRNLATDFALASLAEMVQKEYRPTIQTCSIHEQGKCELFCETCTKLICLTCLTESHRHHEFKEVRRINIADKKRRIQDKTPQYQKSVADLTQALQFVDKQKRDFAVAMVRLNEEVEDEAREMKDKVDDSKRIILSQLDQIKMEREKELKDYSDDLNFKRETTQKFLEESNIVLETKDTYEILQKYTRLVSLGDYRCRIPNIEDNPEVTFTSYKKDIQLGEVSKQISTSVIMIGLMIALVKLLSIVVGCMYVTLEAITTKVWKTKSVMDGILRFLLIIMVAMGVPVILMILVTPVMIFKNKPVLAVVCLAIIIINIIINLEL